MFSSTFLKFARLNQHGLGLIEVMIAVAVFSIVSLELGNIFQMMAANANNLKGLAGAQSLRSSLTETISSQNNNCMNHLLPQYTAAGAFNFATASTQTGMPIGFLGDDGSSQIYGPDPAASPAGAPISLPNYDVSVNSLVFNNAVSLGPDGLGNTLYSGFLVASLLKQSNTTQIIAGGNAMQAMNIGAMTLVVDGTNTIQNCYAQPVSTANACAALGGSYNPAATPKCELPYPCTTGLVFEGYDNTQNPPVAICGASAALGVLTCPAGQYAISNGVGYVCQ